MANSGPASQPARRQCRRAAAAGELALPARSRACGPAARVTRERAPARSDRRTCVGSSLPRPTPQADERAQPGRARSPTATNERSSMKSIRRPDKSSLVLGEIVIAP